MISSYSDNQVKFLLKSLSKDDIEKINIPVIEKERLIQSGLGHYSDFLSFEKKPLESYNQLFKDYTESTKGDLSKYLKSLACQIVNNVYSDEIILVSLVRAGTPIGVLLKQWIEYHYHKKVIHYSVSIIRDRGLDLNAIDYIVKNHDNADSKIVFVDGWTGKGVVGNELKNSIDKYNSINKTRISSDLYVVSDISGTAKYSGTDEDFLISSSVLNSTVSGLLSRSILNASIIGENDFHGAYYFEEYKHLDLSQYFINEIFSEMINDNSDYDFVQINKEQRRIESKSLITTLMKKYNCNNINYIKPGIGESTRVLLRRVPKLVIVKNKNDLSVRHLIILAEQKNIEVIEMPDLIYKAVSIIMELD